MNTTRTSLRLICLIRAKKSGIETSKDSTNNRRHVFLRKKGSIYNVSFPPLLLLSLLLLSLLLQLLLLQLLLLLLLLLPTQLLLLLLLLNHYQVLPMCLTTPAQSPPSYAHCTVLHPLSHFPFPRKSVIPAAIHVTLYKHVLEH